MQLETREPNEIMLRLMRLFRVIRENDITKMPDNELWNNISQKHAKILKDYRDGIIVWITLHLFNCNIGIISIYEYTI